MSDRADNSSARSRHPSRASQAEDTASDNPPSELLVLLGGEETAELLEESPETHEHQHRGATGALVDEEAETERRKALPWWKRPSPWWLLCAVPFSAIAKAATVAPRIEVLTMLACRVHKPDIYNSSYADLVLLPNHRAPLSASATVPSLNETKLIFNAVSTTLKPASPCAADPVVQAAVARLSAVLETVMGILSLITTGWWGAFADRHGRAKILSISLCGLLVTDFTFITVYLFSEFLPGNYWFIMVGALVEGLLGGFSTAVAAQHAYLAETSTDATRARYLSLGLGLMFTGGAFGPTLGSLLIRATGSTIMVFYVSTFLHVLYATLIFLCLPEPLSKRRMNQSRLKYEAELRLSAAERRMGGMAGLYAKARRLFKFLSPLSIFLPDFGVNSGNPLKRQPKDWNLSLLAVAYGFTISIMASFPFIFQYANGTFGWSSETLGYWLTVVGGGRAVWLTICLPIAIKYLKPKPIIIEIPLPPRSGSAPDEQPLISFDDADGTPASPPKTLKKELHSPRFELGVARFSLIVDILAFGIVAVHTSQHSFVLFGVFGSMGIGFSPAVQTLAMALYARRGGIETGRLFGAISVVQALSAQILGPSIYGFVYIRSVATFPRAIFFAGLSSVIISLFVISFIRLPKDDELEKEILGMHHRGDVEEEGTGPEDLVARR